MEEDLVITRDRVTKDIYKKVYDESLCNEDLIKERFLSWIETLLFPLASILWVYNAEVKAKNKVEHLFHFFEALSIFTCEILLSTIAADDNLFNKYIKDIIELDPKHRN